MRDGETCTIVHPGKFLNYHSSTIIFTLICVLPRRNTSAEHQKLWFRHLHLKITKPEVLITALFTLANKMEILNVPIIVVTLVILSSILKHIVVLDNIEGHPSTQIASELFPCNIV